jgi:hypothetical protein
VNRYGNGVGPVVNPLDNDGIITDRRKRYMMGRKTIDVEYIKQAANMYLKQTEDETADYHSNQERKHGVSDLLEVILIHSGNYKGYNYNDKYSEEKDYDRFYY